MHSTPRLALHLLLLLCSFGPALAQNEMQDVAGSSPDIVTVAANAQGIRFTAPNRVVQLRLEIYSELGQKLFDTEQRGGNVLDWHVQNGSGERVADGAYLCVVTVKTLSGRLKQKLGLVTVSAKATAMRATTPADLSSQQTEAVGPVDGDNALTVMPAGESLPATALLHTGDEGQLSRTAGALSFRLGDFFSGKHKEQMRLTEEGNLGIGTDKPQAKLDVTGTIRTSEGIEFANADGTKVTRLTTTATGGLQQMLADGTVVPNATGTGTQNFISKWIDNAGTLGDSNIFESAAGRVGLGTTNPGAKFHVVGTQGSVGAGTFQLDGATLFNNWTAAYPAFEVLNTNPTNNNISLFQFSDAPSGAAHAGIGAVATSHANKFGDLFFFTKQSDGYQMRMGIYGTNVGIGTTAPTAKLQVAGNVDFTGLRTETTASIPNVIGGFSVNSVTAGVSGATIGGGGGDSASDINRVTDSYGTVGGGARNTAGDSTGEISDRPFATVAGGLANIASGSSSTVGGGTLNTASGTQSTVPGGFINTAQGIFSLAAGQRARALHQGSFVWSDSTTVDPSFFSSTANNQFLINATGGVGIGTPLPQASLHVVGTSSDINVPVAVVQSYGFQVPLSFWTANGERARIRSDFSGNLVFATLFGTGRDIFFRAGDDANTDMFIQSSSGNVGIGTTDPTALLHVAGSVKIAASAGTGAALCRNAGTSLVVDCSASSARYKQNIFGLRLGLDVVRRLRPVSFIWKQDGQRDIGLVAEEVNRVEPLLATRNDKGDVEGVRYDRLGVVLLNAVQEQQAQIKVQQQQLQAKDARINNLEARLARYDARLASLDQRLRRGRTAHHARRRNQR